jgi:hypothetical protein
MKSSFTLLFTILIVTILSLISIKIFETKSVNSTNLTNKYVYIQALNHLEFLEEYINSLEDVKNIDEIKIDNKEFYIKAIFKKVALKYKISLEVKAKNFNVRVQKTLTK